MTSPAGLDAANPNETVNGVLGLISGSESNRTADRWATVCSGSGACIPVCQEGINPRFMLSLAKLALARRVPAKTQRSKGHASYRSMTRGVHVLSRVQLNKEELERFGRTEPEPSEKPDIVFYTGCNLLKTPHIALVCFDILEHIGISYAVMGGPADCCGVLQYRTGDVEAAGKLGYRTTSKFAKHGADKVLSWCPTCQVQLGENVLPGRHEEDAGGQRFEFESFVVFLADNIDRLKPYMTNPVHKRVGLHEHPGVAGAGAAAERLLKAVPGLEFVDLEQPKVGWMCNTLQPMPDYKRSLHAELLEAAQAANVTTLAGVYHACHRDMCAHERDWPFEVVNFIELIGESMGIHYEDHFKRLKILQDVDVILSDVAPLALENGLRMDEVRTVLLNALLSEQPLPLRGPALE
jgi:heterodisulfide reductase subunit D